MYGVEGEDYEETIPIGYRTIVSDAAKGPRLNEGERRCLSESILLNPG
jgi:hypothetical protein